MEQNFQTSFIPKKPMIEKVATAKHPTSLFFIISIFIFFAVVLGSGGAYFYRSTLTGNITQMQGDLDKAKNRFEPSKISQLKVLDERLQSSSEILAKHIAISPIFDALQALTMKTIRYTNFGYDFGNDNTVLIKMSGQSIGYYPIALQADLFTKNKNLIDPVFSNLSLDDKGNVTFDLEFSVDPSFVDYKQMLKTESNNSSGAGPTSDTGTVN